MELEDKETAAPWKAVSKPCIQNEHVQQITDIVRDN